MTPEKASVILEYLLPQIESEAKTTRQVLSSVPQERCDYKPSEKCMSARELVRHIVSADGWFLESAANGEMMKPDDSVLQDKTLEELVEAYDTRMAAAISRLRAASGESMAKTMPFFIFEWPAIDIVQLMLKHSIHHRAQLSAYLRPMGAKVPRIYGGSADDPITPAKADA